MQTQFSQDSLANPSVARANEILRRCVHCGLCNATCPTYQVLGDELDGPRGRIYLIKALLEEGGSDRAEVARTHLDRCLTCRACETTCPSSVAYGELLEIGRDAVEAQAKRGLWQRLIRFWLGRVVPSRDWFPRWAAVGRLLRWALPGHLAAALPKRSKPCRLSATATTRPAGRDCRQVGSKPSCLPASTTTATTRRALLLQGCVQRQATPSVNRAAAQYLKARGVEPVLADQEGCCGGLNLHLGQTSQARRTMQRYLDGIAPHLDQLEWIVSTASGCGVTLKEYERLLGEDPHYASLAARAVAMTRDLAEVVAELDDGGDAAQMGRSRTVAWHPPCTLQHGQRITGVVEGLLTNAGYRLVSVKDAHLCCGSAGTYAIVQPELAQRLRDDKLAHLTAEQPDLIATANVGCQMHLSAAADRPVVHWIELLAGR